MARRFDDDESESKHDDDLMINDDNSSETSVTSFFIENNVLPDAPTSPRGTSGRISPPRLITSEDSDSTFRLDVPSCESDKTSETKRGMMSNTTTRHSGLRDKVKSARQLLSSTSPDQAAPAQVPKMSTRSRNLNHEQGLAVRESARCESKSSPGSGQPSVAILNRPDHGSCHSVDKSECSSGPDSLRGIEASLTNAGESQNATKGKASQSLRKTLRKGLSSRGLQSALKSMSKGSRRRLGLTSGAPVGDLLSTTKPSQAAVNPSNRNTSSLKGSTQKDEIGSSDATHNHQCMAAADESSVNADRRGSFRRSVTKASKSLGSEDFSKLLDLDDTPVYTRSLSCDNLGMGPWVFEDEDVENHDGSDTQLDIPSTFVEEKDKAKDQASQSLRKKIQKSHGGRRALGVLKKVSKSTRNIWGKASGTSGNDNSNRDELKGSSHHSSVTLSKNRNEESVALDRRDVLLIDRGGGNGTSGYQSDRSQRSLAKATSRDRKMVDQECSDQTKSSAPGMLHKASKLFNSKTPGYLNDSVSNFSMFSSHSDDKYAALDGSMSSFAQESNSSLSYDCSGDSLVDVVKASTDSNTGLAQFQVCVPQRNERTGKKAADARLSKSRNDANKCENASRSSASDLLEHQNNESSWPSFLAECGEEANCSPRRVGAAPSLLNLNQTDPDLAATDIQDSEGQNGEHYHRADDDNSPSRSDCLVEPKRQPRNRKSSSALREFANRKANEKPTQRAAAEKTSTKPILRQASVTRRRRSQRKIRGESHDDQSSTCSAGEARRRRNNQSEPKRTTGCESDSESVSQSSDEGSRGSGRQLSKSKSSKDLGDPLRRSLHRPASRRRLNNLGYALPMDYGVHGRDTPKRTKSDGGLPATENAATKAEKGTTDGGNKSGDGEGGLSAVQQS